MAFNKEKVMDAARKFVDKGQIDKAVKEYLRIVHEDPKDVRVWLKIGDLYAKKGAKQDATETYLKVARFYHEQGFFLKAVAVYKQILKLDPRLVDVILKLAELYRQLGLMSDAMQHFESVAAHFHREGNTKEALATVKKLVDLDPENIATRIKLAELYSKEGLVEEAVDRVHRRVRAAAPAGPPGRLRQGRRAPALAQARQPRAQPRARRALPAPQRSAARAPEAAGVLQGRSARRRDARPARAGVPGARSEGEDGLACSRSSRASTSRTSSATRPARCSARSSSSCRTTPTRSRSSAGRAVAPPTAATDAAAAAAAPTRRRARAPTPMPARDARGTATRQFNITGDLPALAARRRG